jgi:hypothetical protein
MTKYSKFGISFGKEFLVSRGASPVFYIASTSMVADSDGQSVPRAEYSDEKVRAYQELAGMLDRELRRQYKAVQPLANKLYCVQHMLDFHVFAFMKFFDPRRDDSDSDNYYMEREWRVYGDLQFGLTDVVRVTLPEVYVDRLRADLPGYNGIVTPSEQVSA